MSIVTTFDQLSKPKLVGSFQLTESLAISNAAGVGVQIPIPFIANTVNAVLRISEVMYRWAATTGQQVAYNEQEISITAQLATKIADTGVGILTPDSTFLMSQADWAIRAKGFQNAGTDFLAMTFVENMRCANQQMMRRNGCVLFDRISALGDNLFLNLYGNSNADVITNTVEVLVTAEVYTVSDNQYIAIQNNQRAGCAC